MSVHAVAAIRLLMLTGCRKSEILSLQWTDIDLEAGELRLRESKTGPARGAAVAAGGEGAGGTAPGSGQPLGNPRPEAGHAHDQPGRPVADRAGARGDRERQDSRLPAFSFASRALALGESLPVIAKLLGHSQIRTTARYAHLARDSVKASAARVAASIAEDFLKGSSATAKLPGRQGTDSSG